MANAETERHKQAALRALRALIAARSRPDEAKSRQALADALGGYALRGGTTEEVLSGFVQNLDFYSGLTTLDETVREEFGKAAGVIRALAYGRSGCCGVHQAVAGPL